MTCKPLHVASHTRDGRPVSVMKTLFVQTRGVTGPVSSTFLVVCKGTASVQRAVLAQCSVFLVYLDGFQSVATSELPHHT